MVLVKKSPFGTYPWGEELKTHGEKYKELIINGPCFIAQIIFLINDTTDHFYLALHAFLACHRNKIDTSLISFKQDQCDVLHRYFSVFLSQVLHTIVSKRCNIGTMGNPIRKRQNDYSGGGSDHVKINDIKSAPCHL